MTEHEPDFSDPEFDQGFARGYTTWPLPRRASARYKAGWEYGENLRVHGPIGSFRVAWRSASYRRWVRGCVVAIIVLVAISMVARPLLEPYAGSLPMP